MPGRIPVTLSEFDLYIRTIDTFLNTIVPPAVVSPGTRLGLSGAELTALTNFRKQWYTGLPATPGWYELHTNPATKTPVTRQRVTDIMKNFPVFFNPLLDRMSGSAAITSDDRIILHIAQPVTTHTTPTEAIQETVVSEAKPLGGGEMRFSCRTSHDTKRASKAEGADSVQLAYKIGDPPPANVDEAVTREIFSKATFTLDAGAASTGKKLYFFLRWYNTKHPNLSGPWSPMGSGSIS